MTFLEYEIEGGDYVKAGRASQRLKERLKKVGLEPLAVRRALIAAYEAEANVVIHARHGWMRAYLGQGQLDVEVEDDGPGIPDISQAMAEGFSTAPQAARELGFGAGMGLPNIRRNCDRFAIQSTGDRGTLVTFSIRYQPLDGVGAQGNSLLVDSSLCRQCLRCLSSCPTAAIRLRHDEPECLEHLCIDCTSCISVCETKALSLRHVTDANDSRAELALVVPTPLFYQFGPAVSFSQALAAFKGLGFAEVHCLSPWDDALRRATVSFVETHHVERPVIHPTCPAVLNLIALRFPSLLPMVAPYLSPIEAARETLRGRPAAFVPLCPGQRTTLTMSMGSSCVELVDATSLFTEISRELGPRRRSSGEIDDGETAREILEHDPWKGRVSVLRVSGIRHVVSVLDLAEGGHLEGIQILDLSACEQGCFGSPLLAEEAHVARFRHDHDPPEVSKDEAVVSSDSRRPRPGLRLSCDTSTAIAMLGRLDRLVRSLPGRDCGFCGAPSCSALAEDVVLGRTTTALCPFLDPSTEVIT